MVSLSPVLLPAAAILLGPRIYKHILPNFTLVLLQIHMMIENFRSTEIVVMTLEEKSILTDALAY
jgi:hypothetical protein